MTNPIAKITPIDRGKDLTDEDIEVIVDDFYTVRNWAALQMWMAVPDMKHHLREALKVRLGRRPQVGPVTGD